MATHYARLTSGLIAVLMFASVDAVFADDSLDALAERYVKLSLAFGEIDSHYVDAYTGPAEWREQARAAALPLSVQMTAAAALTTELGAAQADAGEEARLVQLQRNVLALSTRMRMANGERLSFNEEAALLYDAVPPDYDYAEFDAALVELQALLPGDAPLGDKVQALREKLIVSRDKVPAVMEAAIAECRARTVARYELPADERFDLEFVTDKPWSGYNWYQGNNRSLIQVNLDQPFLITRALDLGCHEGYPGHHVWNLYVDNRFVKENGWLEYQVFPLFAPASLFAEGSANYGVELAFPGDTRLAYEQQMLYPIAGLNPDDGAQFEAVSTLMSKLGNARTQISRDYLDGKITREQAIELAMKYRFLSRSRAEQSFDFDDTYRAYVINYTLGLDIVRDYIGRHADSDEARWAVFEALLKTPTAASDLVE
ncbi:MAG: hypothetical protein Q8K17_03210 [Pseudohongiella sp.]|nr:hypothetical protein [Pseudohongiella sp.]MDP2091989.1 hypothetical protein [Pseudohongiella sp.]